jgi:hypothetical protein
VGQQTCDSRGKGGKEGRSSGCTRLTTTAHSCWANQTRAKSIICAHTPAVSSAMLLSGARLPSGRRMRFAWQHRAPAKHSQRASHEDKSWCCGYLHQRRWVCGRVSAG